ncbi:IS3 family transposase [Sorangium sp. So ce1078]|uniref:IS3 family transposase n=1 Tax=Sorangium sp. So ce1078 TaxID=3133329 RepID=UPI003F6363AD
MRAQRLAARSRRRFRRATDSRHNGPIAPNNAVAESFFATLKAELFEHERYPTRAAAIASIGDYIDNFYDLKRRHSRLAYMSPIEFC